MQFVSPCSQAGNCRAKFGHWWIYFLRTAWNCTPASAFWRKNFPWSTQNAVFCRLSISWHASSPRHGGDAGCAMSQDAVASGVQALLAESVAKPRTGGWGLASSHWAPPCWHNLCLPCVCDTWAYAQVCSWVHRWYCIAHPSAGTKFDYSTSASNVITLNRRGAFPLLNSLVCSASLSRGKQVYENATSLF